MDNKEYSNNLKRPFGITLIAIIAIFDGLYSFLQFFEYPGSISIFFGQLISGYIVYAINFTFAAAELYIGYGFLKQKRSAWYVALIYTGIVIINYLLTVFSSVVSIYNYTGYFVQIIVNLVLFFYIYRKRNYFASE